MQQQTRTSTINSISVHAHPNMNGHRNHSIPTVREAFADVLLFFQVKGQREQSGRVMVWVDSQEQVTTQVTSAQSDV